LDGIKGNASEPRDGEKEILETLQDMKILLNLTQELNDFKKESKSSDDANVLWQTNRTDELKNVLDALREMSQSLAGAKRPIASIQSKPLSPSDEIPTVVRRSSIVRKTANMQVEYIPAQGSILPIGRAPMYWRTRK
jgi:hypothetical protein